MAVERASCFGASLSRQVQVSCERLAFHASRGRADARRDAVLRGLGYRVLRLEAALAMRDLASAVALVRAAL
jgi:hypothetical protein